MEAKQKKKVLFLPSWYPSDENPTLGNFVKKHAEVANEVAEVDVLYAVSSNFVTTPEVRDEWVNHVRTVVVVYPKIQSQLPVFKQFLKKRAYFSALKLGYKKLNRKYDWVHLNVAFPAGIFAKWLKKKYAVPYIITEHWTGFLPQNPLFHKLPPYLKAKYKKIFSAAEKVFLVSDHLGKSLMDLGLIRNYKVINNVVSTTTFYPTKNPTEEDDPKRFIHISTFDEHHKNISGMLSAFAQLKQDFILHIITEGEKDEVWSALKNFNIDPRKCIVDSKKTPKEVGEAMRLADALVLFSNYETFSVVLAEAWTTGIPAIYTKCGGLTEINNSDIGVQLPSGDEEALWRALSNFDRNMYSQLKITQFARRFSLTALKEFFREIYN